MDEKGVWKVGSIMRAKSTRKRKVKRKLRALPQGYTLPDQEIWDALTSQNIPASPSMPRQREV